MVMPTLPVKGASLLLGSNLASEMAIMNPIVCDEPSYEDNELENIEVFSACMVTSEMRTKLEENLKNGSTEASDVALKDTLLTDVNDHFLHGDGDMSRYSAYTDQNSCQDIDE
jgi:hypothetical protein